MKYEDFLASKFSTSPACGFDVEPRSDALFPFQRDLVRWAVRRGRAALFADTGLGKSRMQIEWARLVAERTETDVLILAPLAVAAQTVREAASIGVTVTLCRDGADVQSGINITNYDRLHRFDPSRFGAVVLDESGCIKHHDTKTLAQLMAAFSTTPYKLCATATPAPNDFTELGTHAEFLGVCLRSEMLAEYFVHDSGETQTWRLKGHARKHFWQWVASWGALIRRPSDLGYDDAAYALPPLEIEHHTIPVNSEMLKRAGVLFADEARSLTERREARKASVPERVRQCGQMIKECRCVTASTAGSRLSESLTNTRDSLRSDVIAARHAQHAPYAPQSRNEPPPKNASDGKSTCAPIMPHTPKDLADEPKNSEIAITRSDEIAMLPTKRSEGEHARRSANGSGTIRPSASRSVSRNTGSLVNNTASSLAHSKALAPFAAALNQKADPVNDSTSTMIMQPEPCADSFAPSATEESATLESGTMCSSRPQCTCVASEQWVVWCDFNIEQSEITKALGDECVSIYGSQSADEKVALYEQWARGEVRCLVSKPSIFGFGINMQFCRNMAFIGVSDSYEAFYQAVRRCWRFGQSRAVRVHVFASEAEKSVVDNLKRKELDAQRMAHELSIETREAVRAEVQAERRRHVVYQAASPTKIPTWLRRAG